MHIVLTFKESPNDPMSWLIRTAHCWITATSGRDRFSFDVWEHGACKRVDYPQGCTYSDKLKRDLCKLLGDNNAVTVIDEPIRQLSLIDIEPTRNYGD